MAKSVGESYYYLDGKFVERMDGDADTRRKFAKRLKAKVVRITHIRHNITGKGLKIEMSTLKKKSRKRR